MATLTAVAPLTTIWTPPAACVTQTPDIIGGTYDSSSYYVYDYLETYAYQNQQYLTTGSSLVDAECYPPRNQNSIGIDFNYSPAIGCPSGYNTLSSWSGIRVGEVTAACCPSAFDNVYENVIDGEFDGNYVCYRTVSEVGEVMNVVATGDVYEYDNTGSLSYMWQAVSTISATLVRPTNTDGYDIHVTQTAIAITIPASWTTSTPTATSTTSSGSGQDFAKKASSVSTTVGTAVGVIVACLFFYCCCIRPLCRRKRAVPRPIPSRPAHPYSPSSSTSPYSPYTSSAPYSPNNPSTSYGRYTSYVPDFSATDATNAATTSSSQSSTQPNSQPNSKPLPQPNPKSIAQSPEQSNTRPAYPLLSRAHARTSTRPDTQSRTPQLSARATTATASISQPQASNTPQHEKDLTMSEFKPMTLPRGESKSKIGRGPTTRDSMYAQMFDLGPKGAIDSQKTSSTSSTAAVNGNGSTDLSLFDSSSKGSSSGSSSGVSSPGTLSAGTVPPGSKEAIQVVMQDKKNSVKEDEGPKTEAATPHQKASSTPGSPDYTGIYDEGPSHNQPNLSIPISSPPPTLQPGNSRRTSHRSSAGRFPVRPSNPWAAYINSPASPTEPSYTSALQTPPVPKETASAKIPVAPVSSPTSSLKSGAPDTTPVLSPEQKRRTGLLRTEPVFSVGVGGVLDDSGSRTGSDG